MDQSELLAQPSHAAPETIPAAEAPGGGAPRTRILVAVAHQHEDRIARILSGHALVFARAVKDAKSLLDRERFGLVYLGVHFDDSQMFEVLRHVRADARYRRVPIVCSLNSRGSLSDVAIEGLDHAVKAMTANAFLNLDNFSDDAAGNGRIRRIADYLILIDGDLHQGLPA
jgi:hypothetical protein